MNKARGFTLLEVMVSVGILALIMTLVWSTSSTSMRGKKRADERAEIYHKGAVALRKISDDISMAFLAKKAEAPQTGGQAPAETAEPGAKPTLKTFFIGKDKSDKDSLSFTTFSHMRLFKNAKESDQAKVSYEIQESKEDGKGLELIRSEEPSIDQTTDITANSLTLAGGVSEFNIEYYDTRTSEWRKEWNTEAADWAGKLPFAVRVKLSFNDPYDEKKKVEFTTAVTVPLSRGAIEY